MAFFRNSDVWTGAIFIAFGSFALIAGRDYETGTVQQMRAGYFPAVLAWLLCAIGLLVAAKGVIRPPALRLYIPRSTPQAFLVLVAVVLFSVLLERAGLVISTLILVGISALAGHERKKLEIAAVAVTLTILCLVVFLWGIGLPLPLWPVALYDDGTSS